MRHFSPILIAKIAYYFIYLWISNKIRTFLFYFGLLIAYIFPAFMKKKLLGKPIIRDGEEYTITNCLFDQNTKYEAILLYYIINGKTYSHIKDFISKKIGKITDITNLILAIKKGGEIFWTTIFFKTDDQYFCKLIEDLNKIDNSSRQKIFFNTIAFESMQDNDLDCNFD